MAEPLPASPHRPRTGLAESLAHIASMAESQGTRARYLCQVTGIGDSVPANGEIDIKTSNENE